MFIISCCFTSSKFCVVSVSDFGRSSRYVVASHCFQLFHISLMTCEISFYMPICCLYIFFGEVSSKVFGPFLTDEF